MKRFGAIVAIFLLISLYLTTLICALIGTEFAISMLQASVFGTIFIPVILYIYLFVFRALTPKAPEEKDEPTSNEASKDS